MDTSPRKDMLAKLLASYDAKSPEEKKKYDKEFDSYMKSEDGSNINEESLKDEADSQFYENVIKKDAEAIGSDSKIRGALSAGAMLAGAKFCQYCKKYVSTISKCTEPGYSSMYHIGLIKD